MTGPPDRLHYHIEAPGFDGRFTTEMRAAARRQKRLLDQQGHRAYVYECSTADPSCPLLVTGDQPRSTDAGPDP